MFHLKMLPWLQENIIERVENSVEKKANTICWLLHDNRVDNCVNYVFAHFLFLFIKGVNNNDDNDKYERNGVSFHSHNTKSP